jgi:hypothetical protein
MIAFNEIRGLPLIVFGSRRLGAAASSATIGCRLMMDMAVPLGTEMFSSSEGKVVSGHAQRGKRGTARLLKN